MQRLRTRNDEGACVRLPFAESVDFSSIWRTVNVVEIDPITLAAVAGALDSCIREMTVTMRRVAMSPVLAIGNDFSNAIFDAQARMVLQGEDQPVHLGGMMRACKEVATYFGADLAPGDVIYHNDPMTGGSHLPDMTLFKPIFCGDQLMFWTVCRAHMNETGGPVAGGYNPLAEDIWAEGLRISPVKIHDRGKPRSDVIDLLATNFRTRRQFRGDLGAQLAACSQAERRLTKLVERYGVEVMDACISTLLDRAEQLMRSEIDSMPDGEYEASSIVEDDGRGSGELEVRARVSITGDRLHVTLEAPPQTHSYCNSYAGNSVAAVYLGLITYVDPRIPHNEGMYRPVSVELGPIGTVVNAQEPAACGQATSTPFVHIAEALRKALAQALPDRAGGEWARACLEIFTGTDPRNAENYAYLSHLGYGGGGAFWGQDGEAAVGAIPNAGASMTGDIEMIEYMLPLHVRRHEFRPDSACPGRWRGGWGTVTEIEPVGHTTQVLFFGDGMKYPSRSVLGGSLIANEDRASKKWIVRRDGLEPLRLHTIRTLSPGEVERLHSAGGGGVGEPSARRREAVEEDMRNEMVSLESARAEYGYESNERAASPI